MTSLAKGPLFIVNGGPYSALPMSIVFYYFTLAHLCRGAIIIVVGVPHEGM